MESVDFLSTLYYYLDFFFKCIISLILGGIIGYERSVRKKPAGVRTHALICVGASILTFLSFHFSEFADPARIAAQIVSGIGFIGAGTIFVSKQRVQGLTSAATVWVCAAIGMLVGANMTPFAIIAVFSISVMLLIIRSPFHRDGQLYSMTIQFNALDQLDIIKRYITLFGLSIQYQSLRRDKGLELKLHYYSTEVAHYFFFKKLCQTPGIGRVYRV